MNLFDLFTYRKDIIAVYDTMKKYMTESEDDDDDDWEDEDENDDED